jgi:membrane-associated phospholipid phosphatase
MVDAQKNLAERISLVLSAPILAFLAVAIFSSMSPIGLGPFLSDLTSAILGVLFLSILPILPVLYYARKGIVDIDVSDRRMRPKLFGMAILGYSLGVISFYFLQGTSLMVLSVAYVCVTSAVAFVSLFWKISVHTAGVAGPVTGLTYVFGWIAALLYLLLLPVAWARLKLKAHSFLQVFCGSIAAVLVTLAVYLFFYPAAPRPWF